VEEAQGMMKLVEQLKDERELLGSNPSVSHSRPIGPQALVRVIGTAYVVIINQNMFAY